MMIEYFSLFSFYFLLCSAVEKNDFSIKTKVFNIFEKKCENSNTKLPIFKSFVEKSLLKCSLFCLRDPSCKSFRYNRQTGLCSFLACFHGKYCSTNENEIFAASVR